MTPKTLRKERREKFMAILMKYYVGINDDVINELLDAAESRTERAQVLGVEAAMFADRPVTAEDFPQAAEDAALKAFERDMQCAGSWQWYPAKASDEKAWKALREFVVKVYRTEGEKAFEGYFTWARQPYSRGAMTALAIKRNPADFELSWAAYKASEMYQGRKTDEARGVYLDEKGIPIS